MALNAHLRHHGLDPGFGMIAHRPGSTLPPPAPAAPAPEDQAAAGTLMGEEKADSGAEGRPGGGQPP